MAETGKSKATAKKPANAAAKTSTAAAAKPKPAAAAKPKAARTPVKASPAKTKPQNKVKDEMNNFKDKATDKARSAAEAGKERASDAVGGLGKLLRDSAGTIDSNVGKNYGDYARSAADAVDGFASKMSAKDVDDIVGDARDFVRKSPAVAIGAAAAIGFVLVRLLRSGRDDA